MTSYGLDEWFWAMFEPTWTWPNAVWYKAMKSHVSGVSTYVLLFSECGLSLVHHYWVFGRSVAHTSLRGKLMAKLRNFTVQAEAEAKLNGNPVVCLSGEISYRRYRILFVVFDQGLRTMNPHSARPFGGVQIERQFHFGIACRGGPSEY